MLRCLVRLLLRCLFAVTRSVDYSLRARTLTLSLLAYNGRCRIKLYIPAGGASDSIASQGASNFACNDIAILVNRHLSASFSHARL